MARPKTNDDKILFELAVEIVTKPEIYKSHKFNIVAFRRVFEVSGQLKPKSDCADCHRIRKKYNSQQEELVARAREENVRQKIETVLAATATAYAYTYDIINCIAPHLIEATHQLKMFLDTAASVVEAPES